MSKKYNTSFGDITIRVSPEKMNRTAVSLENKIKNIKKILLNLSEAVQDTSTYWEGDVAGKRRVFFNKKKEEMDDIALTVLAYATELKVLTQQYVQTESVIDQASNSLPVNIF